MVITPILALDSCPRITLILPPSRSKSNRSDRTRLNSPANALSRIRLNSEWLIVISRLTTCKLASPVQPPATGGHMDRMSPSFSEVLPLSSGLM